MKRTVKLTTEQIDMMMSEGIVYDVGNVKENPRMLSVAQNNNGYIGIGSFHNGSNSDEPVNVTTDVDKAGETAAEVRSQGINANIVVPANGTDSGELSQAQTDTKNAGADSVKESRFSKKDIMEMRRKYLSENTTTYAKKDFYNRGNGR